MKPMVVVFRICGDQEAGEGIVQTMRQNIPEPMVPDEIGQEQSEIDWKHVARCMSVAMHPIPVDYSALTIKAMGDYGCYPLKGSRIRRVFDCLWGLYGLVVLLVYAEYEKLLTAWCS